jgi:hypothetical protein
MQHGMYLSLMESFVVVVVVIVVVVVVVVVVTGLSYIGDLYMTSGPHEVVEYILEP